MNKTILFAANRGYALISSRRELIERFLHHGWQVVLATADDSDARALASIGAILEPVTFSRGGFSPSQDFSAARRLSQVLRASPPVLIHSFHAKPVMLATLTARWALGEKVRIVNTITGLGHAFTAGGFVTRLASVGYRAALTRADMTIFQNRDDRALFLRKGWVPECKAKLIAGAGVSLERFKYVDRSYRKGSRPSVVMLARLLNQKGIPEFVEIARRVRRKIPDARFRLAGEEEPHHPDAVEMDWLRKATDIEYVGRLSDVMPFLEQADLLLFPSYYREGVPRVVMEAAATGLATVAFDVPGVREAIRHGETGYLVPDRDIDSMTDCVLELLYNKLQRLEFGRQANELAGAAFDIRAVQAAYLDVYRDLGIEI